MFVVPPKIFSSATGVLTPLTAKHQDTEQVLDFKSETPHVRIKVPPLRITQGACA